MIQKTSILTLMFLTLLVSCSKSPKCWGDDKNQGDIVEDFEWPDCYVADVSPDNNYVIRSADDLDTLENCTPAAFPVDFSEYSIIAQPVDGQCKIKVIRELLIDDINKVYVYTVTIKECGLCKKLALDTQFVLVPAIPDDYEVRFVVVHK